jgi:AcrR family transcriptional regulator
VATITIPKTQGSHPKDFKKRKPGKRAGLTKSMIVTAAIKLVETGGIGKFSKRELANELGVGPTTVNFHFKGGVTEISTGIAAATLLGLARPFKAKEAASDYLCELLFGLLKRLHGRPVVARLVVLQLSLNPLLDPLLAERLLLALTEFGVPKEARPRTLKRAMGVILEMILVEPARSNTVEQKKASATMHETIASLPSTEFPNLTELREALVAETLQAGASKPSLELASEYLDRLVAMMGVK